MDGMSHPLRTLDANLNRAREACRVLEDHARFSLNRADLAARVKAFRHDLASAAALAEPDPRRLLAWRDTPGDVGTKVTLPAESSRVDTTSLLRANSARLSEALRTLEESAKLLTRPAAAEAFKQLRYRAYELERSLMLTRPGGRAQWRVCVLLTESLCRRPWRDVAQAALDAGAGCIQLREKTMADAELLGRARALVALARPHDAAVIINDRPDIAVLSGATGVHLGQEDLSVLDARRISGSLLVGVSTADLDQARRAADDGADYIGIGPMFPTTTKVKAMGEGPAFLGAVTSNPALREIPHLAIGGVTPGNIGVLREAGCRGVAVSGAVCGSDDPGSVVRALLGAFQPEAAGDTIGPCTHSGNADCPTA